MARSFGRRPGIGSLAVYVSAMTGFVGQPCRKMTVRLTEALRGASMNLIPRPGYDTVN